MCAECPARFVVCLNTGLRAVRNAEAAAGAELLQGSDEPRALISIPQDNGALDPAIIAQETAHDHYALKNFANIPKLFFFFFFLPIS